MGSKLKWSYTAELIGTCSCDWGCPCNFNAKPTQGFCEGVYAFNIKKGVCGKTKLDGLKVAWAGKWPRAIHEGDGTARIWIEDKATNDQRKALDTMLKGEAGGLPYTIFAATIDNWLDTMYSPFEWKFDGVNSSYKVGTTIQATLASMQNAVTGQASSAKIVLPMGLVFKEAEITSTKSFAVFSKALKFAHPGKYGFYTTVNHGN